MPGRYPTLEVLQRRSPQWKTFIEYLLGCKGLCTYVDDYQMPVAWIAKQLKCSQASVSSKLNYLVSIDELDPVNESYIVGVKAKTYRPEGELYDALQALYPDAGEVDYTALPESVGDGDSSRAILSVLGKCLDEAAFLTWLDSVPEMQGKERYAKALSTMRWHFAKKRKYAPSSGQVQVS